MSDSPFHNMTVASDLTGLLASYGERFDVPAPVIEEALRSVGVTAAAAPGSCTTGRMPYPQWCAALEALYQRVDDPQLGIHIGQVIQPAHCGVLGYLVLSSNTLAEALGQFERYQLLLYGGSLGQASFDHDRLRFVWPQHERSLGVGLSDETLVYGLIHFVRIMVGAQMDETGFAHWLGQTSLAFVHAPTAPESAYRLGGIGEVRFEQPQLSLSLPLSVLAMPVSNRDPALFQLLNQQAEALLRVLPNQADDFDRRVRDYLRRALPEGTPTLDGLASALALSSRTVHRRLAQRGLNFGTLLRQTREELARQYLDQGRISLSEIAFMLGYSEQSAFSRAFKQWTGQTPRQYLQRGARSAALTRSQ